MQRTTFFQTTPRIVMGAGCIDQVAQEIARLKGTSVAVITDPGLVQAGIVDRVEELLTQNSLSFSRFAEVESDPSIEVALKAAEHVKKSGADLIMGIGGGSSLDIAKVAAVLAAHTGEINDFFGVDLVPAAGIKTILVPTTAGTGSEVTPIAILSDVAEKLKKGIVSQHLFPAVAVLDPELTIGLPSHVTAATGLDALIHAVEAYTSKNATSITDLLAAEAMSLICSNIRTAYANGTDMEARANMLEGSLLAGMAFANAGVTAVHAFAYPIGAEFHIPHGVANSIMLAPVMEFNMLGNLPKFADMADFLGEITEGLNDRRAAQLTIDAMRELAADLQIPEHLSDFGVKEEDLPQLSQGVMKVTRLLANNPRELTVEDAEAIYRSVL